MKGKINIYIFTHSYNNGVLSRIKITLHPLNVPT